jgi:hypothetical protein
VLRAEKGNLSVTREASHCLGKAQSMIVAKLRRPSEARIRQLCGRTPHHGKAMTWSQSDHHGGFAAMTSELRSDHPGRARMTCGLCPHHIC